MFELFCIAVGIGVPGLAVAIVLPRSGLFKKPENDKKE